MEWRQGSFTGGIYVVEKLLSKTGNQDFAGDEHYRSLPTDGAKQYRLLNCRAGGTFEAPIAIGPSVAATSRASENGSLRA
jgi:hypothetical protein